MSESGQGENVVVDQQTYVKDNHLGDIYEAILVRLITDKPEEVLPYLIDLLNRYIASNETPVPEAGEGIDTEKGSLQYLEDKNIMSLLESLMSSVLVDRPAQPLPYLVNEIQQRIETNSNGHTFFTDDDLHGIFSLYDGAEEDKITTQQARNALRSLGVKNANNFEIPEVVNSLEFVALARSILSSN